MLLGWERVATLESKVSTEEQFSGNSPAKLAHLAMRPMNALQELGPNTANMNQTPENPFAPGDRVRKREDVDASVGVVVEVLPPETEVEVYGQELDGEVVRVAFPDSLDAGPGDWRDIPPALLSSYCDDQDIDLYTYKPENLAFAENPYTVGDYVVNPSHDDPDLAVIIDIDDDDGTVSVVFGGPRGDQVAPTRLSDHCETENRSIYDYHYSDIAFADMQQH